MASIRRFAIIITVVIYDKCSHFFQNKIKLRLSHFYICFHFPRSIATRDGQGKRFNFYLEILYLFIPFSSRCFMVKSTTLGVILSVKEVLLAITFAGHFFFFFALAIPD